MVRLTDRPNMITPVDLDVKQQNKQNISFSEITGLFELKFHMVYSTIQKKKNTQYKYIYFRSLDENGHHAHTW